MQPSTIAAYDECASTSGVAPISASNARENQNPSRPTGTATITNRAGEDVTVYAAAVAEVLPGFHVAAITAA